MRNLMRFFGAIAVIITAPAFAIEYNSLGEFDSDEKEIFRIHSAIFDAFVPFEYHQMNEELKFLFLQAKSESFKKVLNIPDLKMALSYMFSNIHTLHDVLMVKAYYTFMADRADLARKTSCKSLHSIRDFIRDLPTDFPILPIYDISASDRFKLFAHMIRSEVSFIRRVGFYIRLFYTDAIYGSPIGPLLSGLQKKGEEMAFKIPVFPKLKTPLTYNKKKERIEGHIDAIIVGTGASGSVVGSELQKAGLKIIMVEKGPLVIPGSINTKDNIRFYDTKNLRVSVSGSVALANAMVTGGGPTVNIDLAFLPTLPYIRHQFHKWHMDNLIPSNIWQDDEIDKASSWVANVFKPRNTTRSEVNRNNAMLLKGALALGLPAKLFSLTTYENGKSPHEVTDKKTSFETLILPAMTASENPLTLLHNCGVKKVLKKHGKAIGIECIFKTTDSGPGLLEDIYDFKIPEETAVRIYADVVILAAGNIGTSAVLLASNLKNDNISRGFVIHPLVPLMGRFNQEIISNEGTPSTVFIDHFVPTKKNPHAPGFLLEAASGQPNLGALLMPGTPKQALENMFHLKNSGGVGVILIDTPDPNNHIELHNGELRVHYELSKADKERFISGIKKGMEVLFAAGATDITFNTYESPLFRDDIYESNTIKPSMNLDEVFADFDLVENKTFVMGAHMMAGNKMGIDPKTSVINGNYEVWGLNDLYVVDGSIFPTSVGANPMMTIYTAAKIFSDKFLARAGLESLDYNDY